MLTRRCDYDLGEGDNQEVVLLPDQLFHIQRSDLVASHGTLETIIKKFQSEDVTLNEILQQSIGKGLPQQGWKLVDGIAQYKGRIYIPTDELR